MSLSLSLTNSMSLTRRTSAPAEPPAEPASLVLMDFLNETYEVGGVAALPADMVRTFLPGQVTSNGYDDTAGDYLELELEGDALAAIVFPSTTYLEVSMDDIVSSGVDFQIALQSFSNIVMGFLAYSDAGVDLTSPTDEDFGASVVGTNKLAITITGTDVVLSYNGSAAITRARTDDGTSLTVFFVGFEGPGTAVRVLRVTEAIDNAGLSALTAV